MSLFGKTSNGGFVTFLLSRFFSCPPLPSDFRLVDSTAHAHAGSLDYESLSHPSPAEILSGSFSHIIWLIDLLSLVVSLSPKIIVLSHHRHILSRLVPWSLGHWLVVIYPCDLLAFSHHNATATLTSIVT